ncbi:hypothetical protein HBI56_056400 [Parastagonospora nodorum]|uniref:Uncharacterized protein n=1 Tax=Phaeosphaeria nodorum (strain SN15 / ATCC MYA-4574 / FGSC 10173) TaxID=321614 RepID=A0A7U2NQY8_PHANO|nr:hypothetical protein HBH56_095710 [Parastagonospora nodorum]QRD07184.1 hypothetical protein JI435_424050 [Parastagonospora nodorum SN15]KAH3930161.1 hypothetical protein HBH54_110030 [Parastagonospora nodorum]KAH3945127.1 hypothetical protein HBH53_149410 [Parastagonospora nodorum]KAH3967047.1 hypothetical protein HBH51_140810 [Parastagonospora nodorum]
MGSSVQAFTNYSEYLASLTQGLPTSSPGMKHHRPVTLSAHAAVSIAREACTIMPYRHKSGALAITAWTLHCTIGKVHSADLCLHSTAQISRAWPVVGLLGHAYLQACVC